VTAAATGLMQCWGAMGIIEGIIDRPYQRELRSHYDALQSRIAEDPAAPAAIERRGRGHAGGAGGDGQSRIARAP